MYIAPLHPSVKLCGESTDLYERTFEEEQLLVPVRQDGSKKATLAWGTLHTAEAMDKSWLCSWCSVALKRDGPTWGRNRKPIGPLLGEQWVQLNRLGDTGAKRVKHLYRRSPNSHKGKKSNR